MIILIFDDYTLMYDNDAIIEIVFVGNTYGQSWPDTHITLNICYDQSLATLFFNDLTSNRIFFCRFDYSVTTLRVRFVRIMFEGVFNNLNAL